MILGCAEPFAGVAPALPAAPVTEAVLLRDHLFVRERGTEWLRIQNDETAGGRALYIFWLKPHLDPAKWPAMAFKLPAAGVLEGFYPCKNLWLSSASTGGTVAFQLLLGARKL